MELVDNRYADVDQDDRPGPHRRQRAAGACVTGTEVKDWQKLDFPNLKGRSLLDGKELANGPGQRRDGQRPDLARLARQQAP
jgi:hypothetical protein